MFGTKLKAAAFALLPVMLANAACGSTTAPQETRTSNGSIESGSRVGTNGALVPIDSDNVAMAGYDAESRVMTVLFDSGGLYEYYEVPTWLWEEFLTAQPDPWSTVGYPQLVQGGYTYRELGD